MNYPVIDKLEADSLDYISRFMNLGESLVERQLILLCGLRILDRLFMDFHTGDVDKESKERISETITFAYPALLRQAYCDLTGLKNVPFRALLKDGINDTESFIYSCGLYGMARNLRELIIKDFVVVKKNEKKLLRLSFKDKYSHVDSLEQEYISLYADMMHAFQSKNYDALIAQQNKIITEMNELVYVWKDHYIGYSTNKEIDDFFLANAELDTNEAVEWRAFPLDCTFGGVRYGVFVNTIVHFISFVIKHMQYCILLSEKNPELVIENLLTIPVANEDAIKLIMDINDISQDDATKVFNAITLSINNFKQHTEIRSAAPPLICISDRQCLRSICGCMDRPFEFLLDSLKFMFPKEWDANTFLREEEFREELYAYFDPERYIALHRNIEIKSNGRTLTDIDACLIDKETGEIGFFQLKWQDLVYAKNSLTLSKRLNFKEKTAQWVSSMREWIASISQRQIADHLGISAKYVDKQKIKLFVLGRHNCNFADSVPPDSLVAWGQWYQVLFLLQQYQGCSIDTFFNILQIKNPFNREVIHTEKVHNIGELRIITEAIRSPYIVFRRK